MHRIFSLCSLLFVFSCNTEMTLKKEVFETFVKAVNEGDSITITSLLPSNSVVWNTDTMALTEHFVFFPNYKLEIQSLGEVNGSVTAFGIVSGSMNNEDHLGFRSPFACQADMHDGKIIALRFFGDANMMNELIASAKGRNRSELAVQAFGGVFFKSKDPKTLCAWYDQHLGTTFGKVSYCGFKWRDRIEPGLIGSTAFGIFGENSDYYAPSKSPFMFNFRVNNLDALMEKLKSNGVQQVGEIDRLDYGNFGWIMDPEGNKIELWEPIDAVLEAYENEQDN